MKRDRKGTRFIYRIVFWLSLIMPVFLAVWGVLFFRTMENEINDETDDMLEDYSRDMIIRRLSGVPFPSEGNGTNNTYYISEVTSEYAASVPNISYENREVFISEKDEYEAARVRRQIFLDTSDNRYYELTVAVPTFERRDLMDAVKLWIVVLYFLLLVTSLGIAALVVSYNFRPFRKILAWIDSYSPGRKNPPVPCCDIDIEEFRKLACAVRDESERFERQYEIQTQFIGNASHELQTPLAICSGKIEMMIDSEDMTAEQALALAEIGDTLRGMVKLNKTLLLMTKIDNGQFIETSDVDIASMFEESAAMFEEIYSHKEMTVSISKEGNTPVRMNEQLASILVSNLLKNAFMHGSQKGHIEIAISFSGFSVSNDGDKALDGKHIFDRFYQGNRKKEGSTGLGLALVKSVCDRYGFTVEYEFRGKHRFTVSLK